jgi:hypothetical protein
MRGVGDDRLALGEEDDPEDDSGCADDPGGGDWCGLVGDLFGWTGEWEDVRDRRRNHELSGARRK